MLEIDKRILEFLKEKNSKTHISFIDREILSFRSGLSPSDPKDDILFQSILRLEELTLIYIDEQGLIEITTKGRTELRNIL